MLCSLEQKSTHIQAGSNKKNDQLGGELCMGAKQLAGSGFVHRKEMSIHGLEVGDGFQKVDEGKTL